MLGGEFLIVGVQQLQVTLGVVFENLRPWLSIWGLGAYTVIAKRRNSRWRTSTDDWIRWHCLANRNLSTARHLPTQTWPSLRSTLSSMQNTFGALSSDINRLNILLHLVPRLWESFSSEGSVASVSIWRHISEVIYRHSRHRDNQQSKLKTLELLTFRHHASYI